MRTTQRVALWLIAISLALPPATALSDHFLGCESSWQVVAPSLPVLLFACPQGDTESFIDQGWFITIDCRYTDGSPIANIPGPDFWLIAENEQNIVLCSHSGASNADSATNAQGLTTMSVTTLAAGGCTDGLALVAQNVAFFDCGCGGFTIEPIHVRSPDLDGSLVVDLVDLSIFASHYPPGQYETCCDFNIDGVIDLQDVALFAPHFGPPGHTCN